MRGRQYIAEILMTRTNTGLYTYHSLRRDARRSTTGGTSLQSTRSSRSENSSVPPSSQTSADRLSQANPTDLLLYQTEQLTGEQVGYQGESNPPIQSPCLDNSQAIRPQVSNNDHTSNFDAFFGDLGISEEDLASFGRDFQNAPNE